MLCGMKGSQSICSGTESAPSNRTLDEFPTFQPFCPPHGFVFDRGGFVLYGFVDAEGIVISEG
jgi:hypothetical protein